MSSAFFLNFDAASKFEKEEEVAETVESEGGEEEEQDEEESSGQERQVRKVARFVQSPGWVGRRT